MQNVNIKGKTQNNNKVDKTN